MEIVQLCKSIYNNQLLQSTYLCHKRNMSQIWQVNTFWHSQSLRSHHDDAYLQTLTNILTKCQPSTPSGFQEMAWSRFSNSVSLQHGQRSNQGHTRMLHT